MHQIKWVSPHTNPRNARTHSKKQIRQIADSILAFGFVVPLVVDESNTILLGHGRLAAAIDLDLRTVPVIVLEGLSESKKRALLLADNKITENAGWDRKRLYIELPELAELLVEEGLDISITGFEPVEIDQIAIDFEENTSASCRATTGLESQTEFPGVSAERSVILPKLSTSSRQRPRLARPR